ncbi:BshB3 potential contributor to bacillithiol synthesis [Alkalihalobacillus sp. MEB130]|uniref:BshB3 potential contributor to bacillithiol synthesis n=1 Tax=Alkalihalobacillus sp. MEB130 TaxID=2976704 RepID=UPI0028E05B4B|nr:BshB3 potential contributor to bacillithiol synthesis [Alkalihalobacillus sp. MEB130]MDT8861139.1 BshB3 potential contributor to bacillithiol synthesis [Alkalihalobacillus sp. MEB130]
MKFLLFLVTIVCIISLVITLSLTKTEDTAYSSQRSMKNQLWMYLVLIPILAILIAVIWRFVF